MNDKVLGRTRSEICFVENGISNSKDASPVHGPAPPHISPQTPLQTDNTIQYIVTDGSNAVFGDVLHIHYYQKTEATVTPRSRALISTFPQGLGPLRSRLYHHNEPNRVEAWVQDVHDAQLPPSSTPAESAVDLSGDSAWSNATAAGSAQTSRAPTPTQSLTGISYTDSAQNMLFRRGVISPNATSNSEPRYQGVTAKSMSAMDMHGIYRNSTATLGSRSDCIQVMEDVTISVLDSWNNLPVQTERGPGTEVSAIMDRLSHRACKGYGLYSRTLVHYIRVAVLARHEFEEIKAARALTMKVAEYKIGNGDAGDNCAVNNTAPHVQSSDPDPHCKSGHHSFVSRALQNLNQKPKSQLEQIEKKLAIAIIEIGNLSEFLPQLESQHLFQLSRMIMNLSNEIQDHKRLGKTSETGALRFSVVEGQEKDTPRHQNHRGDFRDFDVLHLHGQQIQKGPGGGDRSSIRKPTYRTEKFSQISIFSKDKELRPRCSIDDSGDSYEFIRFTDSRSITLSSISHITDYSSPETDGLLTNISVLAQLQDPERPCLVDCTKSRCKIIAKYTLQKFECALDQHKLEPGAIINTQWKVTHNRQLLGRARSRSSSVEEMDLVVLTSTPNECWCLPIFDSPPSPWQSWKAYAEKSRFEYHSIGFLNHSHLNTGVPAVRDSRHRNWDLLFPRINLTTVPVQLTRDHRFHCLGTVHQAILPKFLECTKEALTRACEQLVYATPDS